MSVDGLAGTTPLVPTRLRGLKFKENKTRYYPSCLALIVKIPKERVAAGMLKIV
jgi:hypothetical protein